jgi:hypothetical protein
VITSESPAIQILSFRFGVNASFRGLAGACEPPGLAVLGRCAGVGVTGAGAGGSAIFVSISSSPERPITACTPLRGRSRRSAWLTLASGPVSASATSRCQPADLL